MAKKRVIFTLLYSEGSFFLSRNFRLQKGGNVSWLLKNCKFSERAALLNGGPDLARWEAKDAKRQHGHFQAGGQA
jgi:hypothetical protein